MAGMFSWATRLFRNNSSFESFATLRLRHRRSQLECIESNLLDLGRFIREANGWFKAIPALGGSLCVLNG